MVVFRVTLRELERSTIDTRNVMRSPAAPDGVAATAYSWKNPLNSSRKDCSTEAQSTAASLPHTPGQLSAHALHLRPFCSAAWISADASAAPASIVSEDCESSDDQGFFWVVGGELGANRVFFSGGFARFLL